MLVPQALEGVAAVALLAATVRRAAGHLAGLLAGATLALTPVAALMFRFNNPDAMLTLLLVAAGSAVVRAFEAASARWLLAVSAFIGLSFITKTGQALLVVPALGLTYVVAAPTSVRRRLAQLVAAGLAMVAGAGWWIAIVELVPAASRPFGRGGDGAGTGSAITAWVAARFTATTVGAATVYDLRQPAGGSAS